MTQTRIFGLEILFKEEKKRFNLRILLCSEFLWLFKGINALKTLIDCLKHQRTPKKAKRRFQRLWKTLDLRALVLARNSYGLGNYESIG